jgi:hypothetical protein
MTACITTPSGEPPSQAEVETIVAGTLQALPSGAEPASPPPRPGGIFVSANAVQFTIPAGLGTGANVEIIPEARGQEGPSWGAAPAYRKFTIQGYPLQGKFFEAHILVYPAVEFESMNTSAAQSLQQLRQILADPSAPLAVDRLPAVPGFNAARLFAAGIKPLAFQNGGGVRMLTQYAQYNATANNHELFFNFQGLTADGRYYVIAIFPVNATFLASDEQPDTTVPPGGVIPPSNGPDEGYYSTVSEKLDAADAGFFTPALSILDALITSIVVQ